MTLSSPLKDVIESGSILILYGGGNSQFGTAQCHGTDIFLSAAITYQGETKVYDVDLAASGERIDGIVVSQAFPFTVDLDKDSDDVFADNTNLKMGIPTVSEEVYLTAKTAATITYGKTVQCDGGFFEDTDWSANESAANVPYAGSMLLQSQEAVTGVSGIEAIFLAKRV